MEVRTKDDFYKYFVYRHIRLDTDKVFYVGRGKIYHRKLKLKDDVGITYVGRYWRAFNKNNRHRWWNSVTNKTDYDVEIIFESDCFNTICEKEKEFIKLYGRKDLGLGELINMSDGGDGPEGMSINSIDKIKESHKEIGLYQKLRSERVLPMSVYNLSGIFIKTFIDKYECAKFLKCSSTTINNYIYTKNVLNGYLLSREEKKEGINVSDYRIYRGRNTEIEKVIDGVVIGVYKNTVIAKEESGTYMMAIRRSLKTGKPVNGVLWRNSNYTEKVKGNDLHDY